MTQQKTTTRNTQLKPGMERITLDVAEDAARWVRSQAARDGVTESKLVENLIAKAAEVTSL